MLTYDSRLTLVGMSGKLLLTLTITVILESGFCVIHVHTFLSDKLLLDPPEESILVLDHMGYKTHTSLSHS
jgi:hypothetical protein